MYRRLKIDDPEWEETLVHWAGVYDGFTLCRNCETENGDPYNGSFDTDEPVDCHDCYAVLNHVKEIISQEIIEGES